VIHFFYNLIWIFATPIALMRLFWLARKDKGYLKDIAQRFGIFGVTPDNFVIWLHVVSVGETRAAESLVSILRQQNPDCRILLTQMTAAGRATAEATYGRDVSLAWLPWDLPWAQRRFLRAWRPAIGIIFETEMWPNLLAECERAGIPMVLANARLSERSARRYARVPTLTRRMLHRFGVIAAQTDADAGRLRALGSERVVVTGNLKFDNQPPAALVELGRQWRLQIGPRKVVLCASTRDGEEALLLPALLAHLTSDTLIVLVPRHPQRFDDVAALLADQGLTVRRRSADGVPDASVQIWLGDSMGEMFAWYALADVAIIGGSWLPLGGQNLIEACAAGCPVIVGPHTFNFAQATEDALAAGAALRAADAAEAADRAAALLMDDTRRTRMSVAGLAFAQAHRGATARSMALIEPLIERRLAEAAHSNRR
jgi:3-deoxy-D-manno-octulosonic-acid transferase